MAIENLSIIAERINDSVPSTHRLFESEDYDAIVSAAKEQAEQGASYIDVNIGPRGPELMAMLVKRIQEVVNTPLAIDSPSFDTAEAGLAAYDMAKAGNKKPILNSVNLQRLEMFDLVKTYPFKVILMASERVIGGAYVRNKTGEDVFESAKQIYSIAKEKGFENDDILFDPAMAPIGSDYEGLTKMTVVGIALIGSHEDFRGCHQSVGLSNFTVQLPSKTASGAPVKTPLENAFLTITVPKGLDFCIGSTKKDYQFLHDDHPAMLTVKDALRLDGYEVLMRVKEFYS